MTSETLHAALITMRYHGVTGTAVLSGAAEKVEDIVVVKQGQFVPVTWKED
jgi:hypothetical protein